MTKWRIANGVGMNRSSQGFFTRAFKNEKMTYDEYLKCAAKHLRGCESLLKSYEPNSKDDYHVWLELYYLSGYIIEGIVVYSAYKLNEWPSDKDIQKSYDMPFTKRTNLDFYYVRSKKDKDGNEKVPSYFQHRPNGALSVQGHKFQEIVNNLLRPDPSFQNTPYIGNGKIDPDVECLIDKWEPKVRYLYDGTTSSSPNLTKDLVEKLISTCNTIYKQHI